jgi:hypothetical protein
MDKNIGFRRNIYLSWLDATAALCTTTNDEDYIRARLDPILEQQVESKENRNKAISMLLGIWVKAGNEHPDLRAEAVELYGQTEVVEERIWLHYGLTMLYYDFFRTGVAAIGQISRYSDVITPAEVKKRIFAERGQLGALEKATERIIFSLRNWRVLTDSEQRYSYQPLRQRLTSTRPQLEQWLLATALSAHHAQELPFSDLVRLPELFPFRFTVQVDDLRCSSRFEVHRQGLGWDMVRLAYWPVKTTA